MVNNNLSLPELFASHDENGNESFAIFGSSFLQLANFEKSPEESAILFRRNIKQLNEYYRMWRISWFVPIVHSYFFEPVEKFILECHQHGIIDYLDKKYSPKACSAKGNDGEPQVLTMKLLSAGFCLWIGTVIISLVVFILELLINFCFKKKYSKKPKEIKRT